MISHWIIPAPLVSCWPGNTWTPRGPLTFSLTVSLCGPDVRPQLSPYLTPASPMSVQNQPDPHPSFLACLSPRRGSTFLSNHWSISPVTLLLEEMATKADPPLGMGPLPSGEGVWEIPETAKHLGAEDKGGKKVGFPMQVRVTSTSGTPATCQFPRRQSAGRGKTNNIHPYPLEPCLTKAKHVGARRSWWRSCDSWVGGGSLQEGPREVL